MKRTRKLRKKWDDLISEYIFNGIIKPNENIVISYINDKRYSCFLSTRDEEYFEFEVPSKDRYDFMCSYKYDKQSAILRFLCRHKGINDLFYDYGDDYDFVADYDAHVFYKYNLGPKEKRFKSEEYENLVGVEFDRDKIYKNIESINDY